MRAINDRILETPRLILRRWKPEDTDAFARINADPRVMEFFPEPYTREVTIEKIKKFEALADRDGFTFWAAVLKEKQELIGTIGMTIPRIETGVKPCVEIGYRIALEHWGKGLAPEGCRRCIELAFKGLQMKEVVAITAVGNQRSRRVMEKLGMTYDPKDDFDHPEIADGHALKRHVLYRLRATK